MYEQCSGVEHQWIVHVGQAWRMTVLVINYWYVVNESRTMPAKARLYHV